MTIFNLQGKNAIITGASGGLGGAIARSFHAQGAKVILSGTREDALKKLQSELGEGSFVCVSNLADPAAPAALLKEAETLCGGGIDIIVNNAGLTRDGLAMRMKDDDWDAVLNVNLSAAFRLSRAGLKGMMSRRFGRIINITSIVGTMGNAGQANYAASKAGLAGMTKSLAQEMAPRGITVNCIAPGFIVTAMTDALNEEQKNKMLSAIPVGYLGESSDVANCALFLASNEARYVTGQTIHVNGGMLMV